MYSFNSFTIHSTSYTRRDKTVGFQHGNRNGGFVNKCILLGEVRCYQGDTLGDVPCYQGDTPLDVRSGSAGGEVTGEGKESPCDEASHLGDGCRVEDLSLCEEKV